MEFKKLNAPSLRELFVNELQNMILSGNLYFKTDSDIIKGSMKRVE